MSARANERMPAFFFGHGNPMFALERNVYTEGWRRMAREAPAPRAIVCVSAHWYVPYTAVTAQRAPPTLHDFGGFPRELYEIQYPAPGDPLLAARLQSLLGADAVALDQHWGLDHGTWSVLHHAYPEARIPVVQLSIDLEQPAAVHYERGRRLAALREEGILLAGSGNLVHNLHAYAWGRHVPQPYDWALRFEQRVRALIEAGAHAPLLEYDTLGPDAELCVPTPEHFLPLLYVLGSRQPDERADFPVEGIDGGSISMLCVRVAR